MRWVRRVCLLSAALWMAVATLTPPPTTATATTTATGATSGFSVRGTDIIGPAGTPVTLRGVNKSGLEYTASGYDLDLANFERMKSWGVNVVRLALASSFGVPGMCTWNRNYLSTIDRVVAYGEQLKMLVVLDDHFATAGLPCGAGAWSTNQKAPDVFNLAFVKLLAARYKDRPYVAIDLYNEPHDTDWKTWRDGGLVDTYLGVGMQQLLDGVRDAGFTGLVFATGLQWGNDLRELVARPLRDDANVVYAAHAYPFVCGTRTVPQTEPYVCEGKQYPAFLDRAVAPAIGRRPVVLTEFGTQRPVAEENRAQIQWAEDHQIGWIAWLWCSGKITDFCLMTPDRQNTASVIGQPVRDFLP